MQPPVGIRVINNAIENTSEIVAWMQSQETWTHSKIFNTSVEESDMRTSQTLFVPMLSWDNPPFIHDMNKTVWAALDEYATDYGFAFSGIEDSSVQRYEIGDYYKPHTDSMGSTPRIVSAVLYLNTVDSGGETRFTRFDFSVKPVAGRLVIFPSNYVYEHEALPPVSGIKIAAAYWARP